MTSAAWLLSWSLVALPDNTNTGAVANFDLSDSEYKTGLLWRMSRDQTTLGYVFGTMHHGDPRVLAAAPQLEPFLESVDAICPEIDLSMADNLVMMKAMVFDDETTLMDVVGEALFDQIAKALQTHGIPRPFAARLKPWAVLMMLSLPPMDSLDVLDTHLIEIARSASKEVNPLETVVEQISYFVEIPVDDQISMVKDALDQFDELDRYYDAMIDGYVEQDLLVGDRLMREQISHDTEAMIRFMKRLVDERNVTMVTRITEFDETKSCLVAVGMMHLPGSRGVLNLLSEKGITIERIEDFSF